MKEAHPRASMARLCRLFGITRQAYYKRYLSSSIHQKQESIILDLIKEQRILHPRIGGLKLHSMLVDLVQDHGIKLGRDAMFDILREHNMLIRKRRRTWKTTWSNHAFRKYPNRIREFVPTAPNQLWVSDITYLKITQGHVYISLITDAYSRKIVGYDLANNLGSVNALHALKMAIETSKLPLDKLIHHSDRGIQYCSLEYIRLLNKKHITISMTEKGDPLENAIAERINGIIKNEYLYNEDLPNKTTASKRLDEAVRKYNECRPHLSCNMLPPEQIHDFNQPTKRKWKNYYRKNCKLVNQNQELNQPVNQRQE